MYDQLQLREVFHLEFLRYLSRKLKAKNYSLKGGANLRFFFNSFRYSEDMDLDVREVRKDLLIDTVMHILGSGSFQDVLRSFGIERIVPPNISVAKQTETTQRFKVHLITFSGEDLFTKIEFSRRGFKSAAVVQPVPDQILRAYKLLPLLIPHYPINSAVEQKIEALRSRSATQARDIFDLYILSSQYTPSKADSIKISDSQLDIIREKVFEISFDEFNSAVVSYFSAQDQQTYSSPQAWDEVKLHVTHFIEELNKKNV